jgi:hypothetical protein
MAKRTASAPDRTESRVISFRIPADLYDRFLNAIDALSGPPERLRYVSEGRAMVEREVERLERKHNGGKPFPRRPAQD